MHPVNLGDDSDSERRKLHGWGGEPQEGPRAAVGAGLGPSSVRAAAAPTEMPGHRPQTPPQGLSPE